ncbi:hypothetical protein LTR84_004791 [Exophiala bonariae]|uniref:Asteroid domain-containing protein n=1 Tax=Exophiala bonariae TaxID=1690606 RepID=A0AAV9NQF7_9EURO|nr:hypothetical protein LTR84_004791 [Exophiala bonariae]
MGIPRLSQDLHPYADRVPVGKLYPSTSALNLEHLVIDGPSLVYLVYNRLLTYRASRSPVLNGGLPRYSEINHGLQYFLADLEDCGAQIQRIFFDGGLPISKRPVRLDRTEKVRSQLELYRTMHPLDPMVISVGDVDFEEAIWMTPSISSRKSVPPPPPFMVASAIESLCSSKWRNLVSVVPGEADSFCAQAMSGISGAVLTNDSDLAVHDLGENGCLALLSSVEKKSSAQTKTVTSLTIMSLHPQHVAQRLGVPSLLRFGFERYLDPSLSTAITSQRAKDSSRLETFKREYDNFAEQYISPQAGSDAMPSLTDVDPRTAELIISWSHSPTVYLTPILEDPSRDSSWSYGTHYRTLAFSILGWSIPGSHPIGITEFARKGPRIASTTVPQLSEIHIGEHIKQTIKDLRRLFPNNATEVPTNDHGSTLLLNWYILATHKVRQQKSDAGKQPPTLSLIQSTLGLMRHQANNKARATWDEVHFLANMHAVLYSLRMLKQIADYVLRGREPEHTQPNHEESKSQNNGVSTETLLRELTVMLSKMPDIEHLFLDVADLRSRIQELDIEVRSAAIARLANLGDESADGNDDHRLGAVNTSAVPKTNQKLASAAAHITRETEKHWITAKRKRKRARNTSNNNTNTNIGGVRNAGGNSFDVLRMALAD